MARKGGLGKSFAQIQADAAGQHVHPVLSAALFLNSTEKTGGATMNAVTGHLLQPGKPGYVVGGEPDTEGKRIPTKYTEAGKFDVASVLSERSRVRTATGRRAEANVGAWSDAGKVETDASATVGIKNKALSLGATRGEKAIWDNKNAAEVRIPALMPVRPAAAKWGDVPSRKARSSKVSNYSKPFLASKTPAESTGNPLAQLKSLHAAGTLPRPKGWKSA